MLLAVLVLAGGPLGAWAQTAAQQREAAVLKARAGQMAEAQAALRAMLASGVDDGLVAMDLATLLQQDRKPADAVAVFEQIEQLSPVLGPGRTFAREPVHVDLEHRPPSGHGQEREACQVVEVD